jgi:phospholipid/cholesterol/gamma-HCH transport system permease protein
MIRPLQSAILVHAADLLLQSFSWARFSQAAQRRVFLQEFYRAAHGILPWYSAVSLLMILVIVHLVMVTAASYDLSQYSLQVMIRSLVLELIPLFAALAVALRYSLPRSQQIELSAQPTLVLAGSCLMLLLTVLSCMFALLISYLMLFGFTPWGLPGYTHHVGKIFLPETTLVFMAKVALFCAALTVVPVVTQQRLAARGFGRDEISLRSVTRVFMALLVIEVLALIAIYF